MNELLFASIEDVSRGIREKRVSPVELTRGCLDRIARYDSEIHAFISVYPERAIKAAQSAEQEITAGNWRGPLHGVPVALKDLIDIAGEPTTAASRVFANNIAHEDSDLVRNLNQAGAIIIGKTNLHEFAFGGSGVVSAYGPVSNPWDTTRTTGGSSSGSAAAVAAGMCFAAIGTDTAGSIRVPASYCGLVGFKPTWGLVSARGVIPLSKSLDHVGPITRTVRDAEIVLEAISDYRSKPSTLETWRVGVATRFFFDDLDPGVIQAFSLAIHKLSESGITPQTVELPIDNDRTIFNYEVWNYHHGLVERTPELYDPRTLVRIKACSSTTLAEYEQKQRGASQLRQNAHQLLTDIDVILAPTSPIDPPLFAKLIDNPDLRAQELVILRNTRPINVLRIPTITIPCGLSLSGLPVGLQITAATDSDCLAFAQFCEQRLNFTRPELPRD